MSRVEVMLSDAKLVHFDKKGIKEELKTLKDRYLKHFDDSREDDTQLFQDLSCLEQKLQEHREALAELHGISKNTIRENALRSCEKLLKLLKKPDIDSVKFNKFKGKLLKRLRKITEKDADAGADSLFEQKIAAVNTLFNEIKTLFESVKEKLENPDTSRMGWIEWVKYHCNNVWMWIKSHWKELVLGTVVTIGIVVCYIYSGPIIAAFSKAGSLALSGLKTLKSGFVRVETEVVKATLSGYNFALSFWHHAIAHASLFLVSSATVLIKGMCAGMAASAMFVPCYLECIEELEDEDDPELCEDTLESLHRNLKEDNKILAEIKDIAAAAV